ncbi:MAG: lipase family protein [Phormidesmis sp.]
MDYKTALQCARLSQDVYQEFSGIKFREWSGGDPVLVEFGPTDTQLAILEDSSARLGTIIFRGSDKDKDWDINFSVDQTEYEWSREEKEEYREQMKEVAEAVTENEDLIYPDAYSKPSDPVKMHSGFARAYLSVRDRIHNHIKSSDATRYRVTGHSLGGAIATLCAVDLQYNFSPKVAVEAYTFGSPRVGNSAFVDSYNRRVPDTWRVVNGWDAVVGLPVPWQGYRHVDADIKMERGFTWRIITGSFEEHRISNYIKALQSRV